MTSIICLLKLVHLNDLLFDGWVDHVVKEVLKLSIFVVQRAAAPKNGVEFCQGSNGTIRSSLATSYDVAKVLCHRLTDKVTKKRSHLKRWCPTKKNILLVHNEHFVSLPSSRDVTRRPTT